MCHLSRTRISNNDETPEHISFFLHQRRRRSRRAEPTHPNTRHPPPERVDAPIQTERQERHRTPPVDQAQPAVALGGWTRRPASPTTHPDLVHMRQRTRAGVIQAPTLGLTLSTLAGCGSSAPKVCHASPAAPTRPRWSTTPPNAEEPGSLSPRRITSLAGASARPRWRTGAGARGWLRARLDAVEAFGDGEHGIGVGGRWSGCSRRRSRSPSTYWLDRGISGPIYGAFQVSGPWRTRTSNLGFPKAVAAVCGCSGSAC